MVNILGYELPTFSKQKENRGGGSRHETVKINRVKIFLILRKFKLRFLVRNGHN